MDVRYEQMDAILFDGVWARVVADAVMVRGAVGYSTFQGWVHSQGDWIQVHRSPDDPMPAVAFPYDLLKGVQLFSGPIPAGILCVEDGFVPFEESA